MNILVVDDEALVREHLAGTLRKMGYMKVYEATDGIEAVEAAQRVKPDIILADIRMPGMDGIELLSRLKGLIGNVQLIFISGYNLFEYAQKAVNLGALGYLLKPVKVSELKVLLDKAIDIIGQQQKQKEQNINMKIKFNENAKLIKRHIILDMILQKECDKQRLQELSIHFPSTYFRVIVISIDEIGSPTKNLTPGETELLRFSVENIASEVIASHIPVLYPFDTDGYLCYLLNPIDEKTASDHTIYNICCEANRCINDYLHYSTTFGIGKTGHSIQTLCESLETAKKAAAQRLVKGNNQVFLSEEVPLPDTAMLITFKTEQDLLACFERCDQEGAGKLVHELYAPFTASGVVEPVSLMKVNFQLILLIYKILSKLGIEPQILFGNEFIRYNEVNSMNSIASILEWFDSFTGSALEAVISIRDNGNRRLLEKAKEFIHLNYNKDITLDLVADYVHLSPNYFSKLFKQAEKENFIDYLTRYRIEKAKELLKEGLYRANEVSVMVGFNNVKYFYAVFKKLTGVTPGNYKNI